MEYIQEKYPDLEEKAQDEFDDQYNFKTTPDGAIVRKDDGKPVRDYANPKFKGYQVDEKGDTILEGGYVDNFNHLILRSKLAIMKEFFVTERDAINNLEGEDRKIFFSELYEILMSNSNNELSTKQSRRVVGGT